MAPVGSWESLSAAIAAGADSVYFGVEGLNMRAKSSANFTLDDLGRIVAQAREAGVRTYLTVNTAIYDDELSVMRSVIDRAVTEGVDAVIVADQAAMLYARSVGIPVHISTQLNVSNLEALRFYAQWADVVVLARELSLDAVKAIHEGIVRDDIHGPGGELVRIEMFVHGALCMAISGRCYLSVHENCNSANRGACRQICRRSWMLTDTETGEQLAIENKYLLSPKDLCSIEFADRMAEAGVSVFKIEGRARGPEYVKRVVECYSEAVRAIADGTYSAERAAVWKERLGEVFNRGFWEGYYLGARVPELSKHYGSSATKRKVYVGKVTNYFKKIGIAEVLIEATPLEADAQVLITGATTGALEFSLSGLYVDEAPASLAPQGKLCSLPTPAPIHRGDKLFKIVSHD